MRGPLHLMLALAAVALAGCGASEGGGGAPDVADAASGGGGDAAEPDAASGQDTASPEDSAGPGPDGSDTSEGDAAAPPDTMDDAAPGGPALFGVEPAQISARGGTSLTISGEGLATAAGVTLDGVAAQILDADDGAVVVIAPPLVAGTADLVVVLAGGAELSLDDAVVVLPLTLSWAQGLPEGVEAPDAAESRGAVAFDVDLDGDLDLVLATDDGLRVLVNDGGGHFALLRDEEAKAVAPGGRADVRAVAAGDVDGDGAPELAVCTGAGRDLLLRGAPGGLTHALTLPWRAGGCRAVTVAHADGDGLPDLVMALDGAEGVALHALVHGPKSSLWPDDRLAPPSNAEDAVGSATSGDVEAGLSFVRVLEGAAQGYAAGHLSATLTEAGPEAVFELPASVPAIPERLQLSLRGDGSPISARIRVEDGAGATFDSPPLELGAAWSDAELTDLAAWGGETSLVPPLKSVAVVLSTEAPLPLTAEVWIDAVTAESDGFVPWLVEDFERWSPWWHWPEVPAVLAGDLDGDALDDLLVLPGAADAGPTALRTLGAADAPGEAPPYVAGPVTVGGAGPFFSGALFDADGDGDRDVVLPSAGAQDRLLYGDGWGQLLDGTAGALPVDWSAGRAIAAADVDLDGATDVFIGNDGQTDRLYLGLGDGRFVDATVAFGFDDLDTAAVVLADLDGDGDLDAVSVPRAGTSAPHLRFAVGEDE
jgi:hypothetical protein